MSERSLHTMVLLNKRLRDADPDTCAQIDKLRIERRPLVKRLSYLRTAGGHTETVASEAEGITQGEGIS